MTSLCARLPQNLSSLSFGFGVFYSIVVLGIATNIVAWCLETGFVSARGFLPSLSRVAADRESKYSTVQKILQSLIATSLPVLSVVVSACLPGSTRLLVAGLSLCPFVFGLLLTWVFDDENTNEHMSLAQLSFVFSFFLVLGLMANLPQKNRIRSYLPFAALFSLLLVLVSDTIRSNNTSVIFENLFTLGEYSTIVSGLWLLQSMIQSAAP
jgi:hypothetical protein